ncbi:MAG TPA: restriction endonuclease, SacI family [Acetobacteraceae bacterium]|nr:restriction endonuclease, SacI family [Acetobacteraceae bacterium]
MINSEQTAIRFCLPTQLLGKLIDPALDAMCLQRGSGEGGRWDPRGFAARVIVPWNRENQSVLGPSGDPYVSNPLRRPRVDAGLDQMSDREQWEKLCAVLRDVEETNKPEHTERVLIRVLGVIRDRLRDLTFIYIVPQRVSITQADELVREFLAEGSGGDRGLAVVAALFETFRERLGLYQEIRRNVINAADAATNSAGDLECIGTDGRVVLAVEVKERRIGDDDVHSAIAKAREFVIRELLLCTEGTVHGEQDAVAKTFTSAWASGTNIYHLTIHELMRGVLPLLGEGGIRGFVVEVGTQLDKFSTQPRHRKTWKSLLDRL